MVITFTQERKKQRYMILALALVIFSILLIIWLGFGREEKPIPSAARVFLPREVKIDWSALKDPRLQGLLPFEEIGEFKEEIGRENPFIPY